MEVQDSTIQDAFSSGGKIQYRLPHFQREYAWEKRNWDMFYDDVLALYKLEWENPDSAPKHFLGTIVVQYEGKHGLTLNYFKLVDGQQRLVTASLLLCALRDYVGTSSNLYNDINGFLVNEGQVGDLYFKLVPSQMYGDREAYARIVKGEAGDNSSTSNISEAFSHYVRCLQIENRRSPLNVERMVLCILSCMEIVFVDLNKGESPYKIFESLNAKGKELSQSDLVRNYVAMMLPTNEQEEVFDKYWRGIEEKLQEKRKIGKIGELTAFLRHYLAFKTGAVPNMNRVYETFRTRITKDFQSVDAFVNEISELHRFSRFYDGLLRPANESDNQVQKSFFRLQRAESVTAYPLLLFLYDLFDQNAITKAEYCDALHLIENFIIRVFLNGGSTTGFNTLFPSLIAKLDEDAVVHTLRTAISGQRMYPSDNLIRQNLVTNTMYDSKRQSRLVFILENVNRHLSHGKGGYTLLDDVATIEHIMPQKMTREWQTYLGENWETDHRDYCNTIGNLTILSQKWNTSISNGSFAKKKAKLSNNELRLNRDYFSRDIATWNTSAIVQRANALTDVALQVWPSIRTSEATDDYTGRVPVSVKIDGLTVPVESWAEVTVRTAEMVFARVEDTASFANRHTGLRIPYFRRDKAKYYKKMNNGWYVYINRYAGSHVKFCQDLVVSSGLDAADWSVEVEANMP